ncbi:hypothetical protein RJ640_004358 [Escallonia rubra]|uniref:AAA+ ATPase domain-containing protein n=1 Tax=Escallonia rubra TaxID=112253 RepID=A0AA88RD19_9ASTE|nr:hypothetical protein RJ640_004358 [Escallonia rubra]
MNATLRSEVRSYGYELSFHKKNKERVLNSNLPYILETSKAIKEESKAITLHTVKYNCKWSSNAVNLGHQMTFKTLALDSKLKHTIIKDLDNFIKGKDFYRKIGRAWKRGYLLYGPPGTGKSSLIAATGNYLNYDIYDLDLTDVESNAHLRSLLLSMSNQSILVIEDIDCTIKVQNRESRDKFKNQENTARIIIFTTNHKDRLDPALMRPRRMDMHIHMSYCTYSAFKQLAFNYLGISHHQLFDQIEELLRQAEVARELMKKSNTEVSLQGLLEFLENKVSEQDKVKTDATCGCTELGS